MRCRYLDLSDEAYAIHEDGSRTVATVHLCNWPDMHPERMIDGPRWLLRLIGSGLAVTPETDCVGCPAYKRAEQ